MLKEKKKKVYCTVGNIKYDHLKEERELQVMCRASNSHLLHTYLSVCTPLVLETQFLPDLMPLHHSKMILCI